jgi:hypothetical protein
MGKTHPPMRLLLHLLLTMLRWGNPFSLSQVHSLGKNMGTISEPKLNVVEKRWAWVASSIFFEVKVGATFGLVDQDHV